MNNLENVRHCFQPRQWFILAGEADPFIKSEEDCFMWVYREGIGGYQVGYFQPDGVWFTDGSYSTREQAAERVSYLNGHNKE